MQYLENSKRILVFAPNWVGDAVMSLPAVKKLGEICPDSQIDILCKPFVKDVYVNNPIIKNIIELNSHNWKSEIKGQEYDTVILFPNSFKSALIASQLNIKSRIGYSGEFRRLLLTHSVKTNKKLKKSHHAYYYLNLIDGDSNEESGQT